MTTCRYCTRPAPLARRAAAAVAVRLHRLARWIDDRAGDICGVCGGTNRGEW